MAHDVIRAGREAAGHKRHPLHGVDRRVRAQAPHPVPVGGAVLARGRRRPVGQAARGDQLRRGLGRNIGMRYHDGQPSMVEGLLSRGDRRVGAVIEQVWRDGGRFDGWSEHFSYTLDRRGRGSASTSPGTPPASATATRSCPGTTSTRAWTSSGSGTTGRTRSASSSRTTAAGRPASTAASARTWAPTSRSGPPAARCCRSYRPASARTPHPAPLRGSQLVGRSGGQAAGLAPLAGERQPVGRRRRLRARRCPGEEIALCAGIGEQRRPVPGDLTAPFGEQCLAGSGNTIRLRTRPGPARR